MASGFFAILDDIALLMDDVATMGKVATKKTAGILGDDLSVNAEKATGFVSSRELPVLWAITKGSFLNKLIILPLTFLLNHFFPTGIVVILMLGGAYLAYEGVEKIIEFFFHAKPTKKDHSEVLDNDISALEKTKIKSAITTDFILSAEIIIIALSTVLEKSLSIQILVVSFVALIATVGVYGIVALIVRMDDMGLYLIKKSNEKGLLFSFGKILVQSLPWIIKILSVVGTLALLLVSGGIFSHNIPILHDVLSSWPSMLKEFLLGLIVGLIVVAIVTPLIKLFGKKVN
jgi:predicted DNA repair protein MutK